MRTGSGEREQTDSISLRHESSSLLLVFKEFHFTLSPEHFPRGHELSVSVEIKKPTLTQTTSPDPPTSFLNNWLIDEHHTASLC